MAHFEVVSVDVPSAPLFDPKDFAHKEFEDSSWIHIYTAEDREGRVWFKCVRGDGLGGVFTEYMDISKLLRDWASFAMVMGLMAAPGGDAVSGV